MAEKVSIQGLNKAAVLAALYNNARAQGLGFLQYDAKPMTVEDAQGHLDRGQTYFDYLQGRVLKVSLEGDSFDPWGYDRDNGQGSAQRVVDELRNYGETNPVSSQHAHTVQSHKAIQEIKEQPGFLGDLADPLRRAIDESGLDYDED